MRNQFFGLSIFAVLASGCSIFPSASAQPADLRQLREEWQDVWQDTEFQMELAELPSAVKKALALLPSANAASKAFLIHRDGEFRAFRIELNDQTALHYSDDGTSIEKPQQSVSTHGGIL